MRHALEIPEPLIDLRIVEAINTFGAEPLDVERSHHRTINACSPHRLVGDLFLACEITHESAGKSVACARRVENAFEWISRRREEAIFCEQRRAIFPALDDDCLQAIVHDLLR